MTKYSCAYFLKNEVDGLGTRYGAFTKYILNDRLFDISCSDLQHELVDQEYHHADKPSMVELEKLSSVKEIYEYLKEYMEKYNQSESELMEQLAKLVEIERFYGNRKKDAIKYIKDYYNLD